MRDRGWPLARRGRGEGGLGERDSRDLEKTGGVNTEDAFGDNEQIGEVKRLHASMDQQMTTKAMTLRLTAEQAAELEAVAQVEERPISEMAREAIDRMIEERRADKDFQARLTRRIKENAAALERLAR